MNGRERGAATVLMTAVLGLALLLVAGVARVGGAAMLRARADAAADASALAAADALALGRGPSAARSAAAETAAANGARLLSCECGGRAAEVVVAVDATLPGLPREVRGRARAEIDLAGWLDVSAEETSGRAA